MNSDRWWHHILSYLGCLLTGHAVYSIGWPILEAGEAHTACIHCKLTLPQMQRMALIWYTLVLAATLLLVSCIPLTTRQPDPTCYIIGVHWNANHVDRLTERCGDTTRSFRPSHP